VASISNDPNGRRRILFVDHDGRRKTIRGRSMKRDVQRRLLDDLRLAATYPSE
jgi:hypothetical protein